MRERALVAHLACADGGCSRQRCADCGLKHVHHAVSRREQASTCDVARRARRGQEDGRSKRGPPQNRQPLQPRAARRVRVAAASGARETRARGRTHTAPAMADAAMADAEDVVARPAGAAKKGKVDYVALEADVQAQLQVASQVRAPRTAAPPLLRAYARAHAPANDAALKRRAPAFAPRCPSAGAPHRGGRGAAEHREDAAPGAPWLTHLPARLSARC